MGAVNQLFFNYLFTCILLMMMIIVVKRGGGLPLAADDGRRLAPWLLHFSLAARRLCSIIAHESAGVGGTEAAQGRREREGSLAALP